MAAKGQKHILKAGSNDKRSITLTVCESLDGKILPFQLIYKGKTQKLLPTVDFPDRFCLSCNAVHWSYEKETVCLIEQVLVPDIKKFKKKKVYQTIKKVSLYGTLLKLNLRSMYLMFYQSTELNLLCYQRT